MKAFFTSLSRYRLSWVVLAAAIAALAYWMFFAGSARSRVTYDTAEVGRGDIRVSVASSGAVSPLNTVTVGAQVSGQLTEINVDFNSKVKKDQLLAVIEPSIFQSKVRSAEADLIVQTATIGSNEVQVNSAQVNLDQAKRDFDRTQTLATQGLMSTYDLEKARNTNEQMQNALKISQAVLNTSKAQRVRFRAQLDQARIDLSHTQIRSPVDGVVIERAVDVGQTVQSAMTAPTLFKIARDLSQVQIETKVDEADIGSVQQSKVATFTVDAYPDRSFKGRIAQVRINGSATFNVVTYSVMVQAENPAQVLLPGMTANVKLVTADRRSVLRIPSGALRFRPSTDSTSAALAAAQASTRTQSGSGGGGGGGGGGLPGGGGFPGGGRGPQGAGPGGAAGGGGVATARTTTQHPLVELTPEIMQQLGLDAKQQAAATAALKDVANRIKADATKSTTSNPLGGGMPNFRRMLGNPADDIAANRQRMLNALAAAMSEEQLQKYEGMSAALTERSATIYVLDAAGKPAAKSVRVGLADDNYTEVISGLGEGDKVVVRAHTATKA